MRDLQEYQGDFSPDKSKFPDFSLTICSTPTHVASLYQVSATGTKTDTGAAPKRKVSNKQFSLTAFSHDTSLTFCQFVYISQTAVKLPTFPGNWSF